MGKIQYVKQWANLDDISIKVIAVTLPIFSSLLQSSSCPKLQVGHTVRTTGNTCVGDIGCRGQPDKCTGGSTSKVTLHSVHTKLHAHKRSYPILLQTKIQRLRTSTNHLLHLPKYHLISEPRHNLNFWGNYFFLS